MTKTLDKYSLLASILIAAGLAACSGPSSTDVPEESGEVTEQAVSTDDASVSDSGEAELPPLRAGQKMARCVIGPDRYEGPCVFQSESNGSFYVGMRDESAFYGDVTMVSVYVTEPGKAEVRGLTSGGNNSRWGVAERSEEDKACWVGADFTVCAY